MLRFKVHRTHGSFAPKNLDKLPEWVSYTMDGEYLDCVTIHRDPTYALVRELTELQCAVDVSLKNSNRKIAGEEVLMCSTLYLIYHTLADGLDEMLRLRSWELSGEKYYLPMGCLEDRTYKRSLHAVEADKSTPEDTGLGAIIHDLRVMVEESFSGHAAVMQEAYGEANHMAVNKNRQVYAMNNVGYIVNLTDGYGVFTNYQNEVCYSYFSKDDSIWDARLSKFTVEDNIV